MPRADTYDRDLTMRGLGDDPDETIDALVSDVAPEADGAGTWYGVQVVVCAG